MSWPCHLIDWTPALDAAQLRIGDMLQFDAAKHDAEEWPWWGMGKDGSRLADFFRANNAHRGPIFVWLPGRTLFCVDGKCWKDGAYYGGWTVTGQAPLITVAPSIDIGGSYHGFLQNGVISDDVAGKRFDEITGTELRK